MATNKICQTYVVLFVILISFVFITFGEDFSPDTRCDHTKLSTNYERAIYDATIVHVCIKLKYRTERKQV